MTTLRLGRSGGARPARRASFPAPELGDNGPVHCRGPARGVPRGRPARPRDRHASAGTDLQRCLAMVDRVAERPGPDVPVDDEPGCGAWATRRRRRPPSSPCSGHRRSAGRETGDLLSWPRTWPRRLICRQRQARDIAVSLLLGAVPDSRLDRLRQDKLPSWWTRECPGNPGRRPPGRRAIRPPFRLFLSPHQLSAFVHAVRAPWHSAVAPSYGTAGSRSARMRPGLRRRTRTGCAPSAPSGRAPPRATSTSTSSATRITATTPPGRSACRWTTKTVATLSSRARTRASRTSVPSMPTCCTSARWVPRSTCT